MDMTRFRSPQAEGIFEGDSNGFSSWHRWASGIRQGITDIDTRRMLMSSSVTTEETKHVVAMCMKNPESSIHVLVNSMLQGRISWTHLSVLEQVSHLCNAGFPDVDDIGGAFVPQVIRALTWYERLQDPAPGITIQSGIRMFEAPGIPEGFLRADCLDRDHLRLLVSRNGRDAASIVMDRKAVATLTRRAWNMDVEEIFLGSGTGEGRNGLVVMPYGIDTPFRAVALLSIVAPGPNSIPAVKMSLWTFLKLMNEVCKEMSLPYPDIDIDIDSHNPGPGP